MAKVQIKSNSNTAPKVFVSLFKGLLSKPAQNDIDEEIQFLIEVFTENGYKRKTLENITKQYLNELQKSPVNKKDTNVDLNKAAELPRILIIGPKLRHVFKKKIKKTIFKSVPNLKCCCYAKQEKAIT